MPTDPCPDPPLEAAFRACAVDNLHDGVYFVDSSRQILYWNQAAERISGYASAEVLGRPCFDNVLKHVDGLGRELCQTACPLAKTIADGRTREAQVYLFHRDGHRQPVEVRTVPVRDPRGTIIGAVEVFADSSEAIAVRRKLDELSRMALVDALTGVGNRRYAEMTLRAAAAEAQRYGRPYAVLFIDIDHFKPVNDTHGHSVGDEVLRTVARTITDSSRIFDTVARWGGEEFVVIAPHVSGADTDTLANRLRTLVARSAVTLPQGPVHVTVSVGAIVSGGQSSAEAVIDRADRLMYAAKAAGRNRVASDVLP